MQKKLKSIFTKIRNKLNEREDELLLDIENIFNKLYFNDDIIKIIEKLPTRIKSSLEKGKEINEEWTEKQLNYLINICINIENTWTDINTIKWKIEKSNFNMKTKILFKPEKEGINNIINTIKNFGEIYIKNFQKYALRNCPLNNDEKIKFEISGKNNNIFTKSCNDQDDDIGTICINELDKSIEEHRWKIKILKTKKRRISVGVATIDFDINSLDPGETCGWYFYCENSLLYSGPPFYYFDKESGLNNVDDEITVIMNMKKKSLKFIINDEDKGDSFTNIPIDKPIFPSVLLMDQDDSIEITEYD